jgi:capsular polysaccharide export protein
MTEKALTSLEWAKGGRKQSMGSPLVTPAVSADQAHGPAVGAGVSPPGLGPVLILQGPLGGFFDCLARTLRSAGVPVDRVHFNIADRLMGGRRGDIFFRGRLADWDIWLRDYCTRRKPRCIILFGDRRPVHVVACDIAAAFGVRIFSFEEGYIRPDFVTFEEHGNNARSRFRLDPDWQGEVQPIEHVPSTFGRMGWMATGYYILKTLERPFNLHYRHHRNRGALKESLLWNWSWMRKFMRQRSERHLLRRFRRAQTPVFVVALQVHDDLQLVHHARGWTPERLICESVAAFARSAAENTHLVIRGHPMDRGHRNYSRLVRQQAAEHHVAGRVHLVETGNGPALLSKALGCITINSTITFSALYHRCPVAIVGSAFFEDSGLVTKIREEGELDGFFRSRPTVDGAAFEAFRAQIIARTQLNGTYYSADWSARLAEAAVGKLREAGVVAPATMPDDQAASSH